MRKGDERRRLVEAVSTLSRLLRKKIGTVESLPIETKILRLTKVGRWEIRK